MTKSKSRQYLAAVLGILALALILALVVRPVAATGAERGGARASSARLADLLRRVPGPQVPAVDQRAAARLNPAEYVQSIELPNGIVGVLYPEKTIAGAGQPVMIHLDLFGPAGLPLPGRRDLEVVSHVVGSSEQPEKGGFAESLYDAPGRYVATIPAREAMRKPGELFVAVSVSETGNPNEPGTSVSGVTRVAVGQPAALEGTPGGKWSSEGLMVMVPVIAEGPGRARVSATLLDEAGQALGKASGEADVAAGPSFVKLLFDGAAPSNDGKRSYQLVELVLWFGDPARISDYQAAPVRLTVQDDRPASVTP